MLKIKALNKSKPVNYGVVTRKYAKYKIRGCYVKLHRTGILKNKITNIENCKEKLKETSNYQISPKRTGEDTNRRNTVNLEISRNSDKNKGKFVLRKCRVVLCQHHSNYSSNNNFDKDVSCTGERSMEGGKVNCGMKKSQDASTCNYVRKFYRNRDHLRNNQKELIKNKSTQSSNSFDLNRVQTSSDIHSLNKYDIYEFGSQGNKLEAKDISSDIVQKLIQEGKAALVKHKGKYIERKKRKKTAREIFRNISKNLMQNSDIMHLIRSKNKKDLNSKSSSNKPEVDVGNNKENHDHSGVIWPIEENIVVKEQPQRESVTDKKKLLDIARNLVCKSTPNKANTSIANNFTPTNKAKHVVFTSTAYRKKEQEQINGFSPIFSSSPWRVSNENTLPRIFHFSRNKDDLPSYSSDVIPSSQRENVLSETKSVNLSNIENIPPNSNSKRISDSRVEALNVSNTKSQGRLISRSPLKAINILEVINLPTCAKVLQDYSHIIFDSNKRKQDKFDNSGKSNALQKNEKNVDYFGFDESTDDDFEESSKNIPSKDALKKKLKKLKTLLPKRRTKIISKSTKPISIMDKQSTIKEMFSPAKIPKLPEREIDESSTDYLDKTINLSVGDKSSDQNITPHLFDDIEDPPAYFNSTENMRSYTRFPKKRKREHQWTMHSDNESEVESPKKKQPKGADKKAEIELNKFVAEFNVMCEKVDRYELHVEKEINN